MIRPSGSERNGRAKNKGRGSAKNQFPQGATAGLSSSADPVGTAKHCWASQQWHPTTNRRTGCDIPLL